MQVGGSSLSNDDDNNNNKPRNGAPPPRSNGASPPSSSTNPRSQLLLALVLISVSSHILFYLESGGMACSSSQHGGRRQRQRPAPPPPNNNAAPTTTLVVVVNATTQLRGGSPSDDATTTETTASNQDAAPVEQAQQETSSSNNPYYYYTPTDKERELIINMVETSLTKVDMGTHDRSKFFKQEDNQRCALNFYGLPRSFISMSLHSIIQNILIPNAPYDCDVFCNYHYLTQESAGRSGFGGQLNPNDILLLQEAVRQVGLRMHGPQYQPTIRFSNYTNDEFFKKHKVFLNTTRTVMDGEGKPVYLPHRDKTYTFDQTDNIVRMWHSQGAVWDLMDQTARELNRNYTRVAMFRSDVFFLRPMDVLEDGNGNVDYKHEFVVLPGFAKFPVNDRMVLGPYGGIRPWAKDRFSLIASHVLMVDRKSRGWGMQSEWFVEQTLLPAIERAGYTIQEDARMCFLRVRPNDGVWVREGCGGDPVQNALEVAELIGRPCLASSASKGTPGGVIVYNCKAQEDMDEATLRQIYPHFYKHRDKVEKKSKVVDEDGTVKYVSSFKGTRHAASNSARLHEAIAKMAASKAVGPGADELRAKAAKLEAKRLAAEKAVREHGGEKKEGGDDKGATDGDAADHHHQEEKKQGDAAADEEEEDATRTDTDQKEGKKKAEQFDAGGDHAGATATE